MREKPTLSLAAGKKYRTRDGKIVEVGPDPFGDDNWFTGQMEDSDLAFYWFHDGKFLPSVGETSDDLVEEIVEEAPKKTLSLEVGKSYWNGFGQLKHIVKKERDLPDEVWFEDDSGFGYYPDGRSLLSPSSYSLVEEFKPRDEAFPEETTATLQTDDANGRQVRENGFVKNDKEKPDYSFIEDLSRELAQIFQLLEYGAKKYGRDNWKLGDKQSYKKAFYRHLLAGPSNIDKETGLPHRISMLVNLLFEQYLENEENDTNN